MIELKRVSKFYQQGPNRHQVLNEVSLNIEQGEFVSIMGPSGSGKSTLVNVLGFLDADYEGEYIFDGESTVSRNDNQISKLRNEMVGFVYQSFNLIDSISIEDNVQLPLLYNGYSVAETHEKVKKSLERVGLGNKLKSTPKELSGGQKQRVAIARALVNEPRFIIADEPTGALDTKTSRMIMTTLERLNREDGVTIVMVTHDPTLEDYTNRRIRVVDGHVVTNTLIDDETYLRGKEKYQPVYFESEEQSVQSVPEDKAEAAQQRSRVARRFFKRGKKSGGDKS